MNRENIIRMAREAGFPEAILELSPTALERFAALVASAEREACIVELIECREALAQPEQKAVAFVKGCNRGQWEIFPAKAYQIFEREQPLYTTPPQRKPLTDEEITDAVREAGFDWHYGWTLDDEEPNRFTKFARAIEAAHGIKGEA